MEYVLLKTKKPPFQMVLWFLQKQPPCIYVELYGTAYSMYQVFIKILQLHGVIYM